MNKVIWLDLEETIINNWNDGLFTYHTHQLKQWLKKQDVTSVNIFSFAIYDVKDKAHFLSSGMKTSIEQALGVIIDEVPSVADIQAQVYKYESVKYDSLYEFIQLNGKQWGFIKFCQLSPDQHNILIDDAVLTCTFINDKTQQKTQLINVFDIY